MVRLLAVGTVLGWALSGVAVAEENTGRLKAGDYLGAFTVTKVAGCEQDGVQHGQSLCYRCKFGARPQVLVFSRSANAEVAELAKYLQQQMAANEAIQMRGLISMLGSDREQLSEAAKKLAAEHDLTLPIALAADLEKGPSSYKIDPDAEVTIVLANDSAVIRSLSFAPGQLDIEAVKAAIAKML
jgi:hypothetical protein